MRIHILGICGTFMGGVAALAQAAGHRVTGSDEHVYPPMSEQLRSLGIELYQGYLPEHLQPEPDVVIVGNVISRGNPALEYALDRGMDLMSGPEWLARHVLRDRWVLAVAGTHGKTTTTSLLTHILDRVGLSPGFLVGGVPTGFGVSARLGEGPFFVVEADEYDTAFFDKRAKFVHYRPRTLILNNLEHDHTDIYPDLDSLYRQFHHVVRTVPSSGQIVVNGLDRRLDHVLEMGCWTPVVRFGADDSWHAQLIERDGSAFRVCEAGTPVGEVRWALFGQHNVANALAAVLAARHAGVPVAEGCRALSDFSGVRRRLEHRGEAGGVAVYDDFAHHPTAIELGIDALKRRVGNRRVLAVLELRSNSMRLGAHRDSLAHSLLGADHSFVVPGAGISWDVAATLAPLGAHATVCPDVDATISAVLSSARPNDQILVMSNGGFGGIHERLLAELAGREAGQ
ncbi:MAG: UDP-N-acetylmuramate:L-alanyl-gamma-D-glutamyl-meso-diaminopimelate ligase [Pseudomonadota bacterium]|nr:UDP-N-acetylmuramate:L-alanyl-gamma-D-glutamyl-meso-diaminopimelate ligase [Pseudomonadota bacterium]